MKRRLIWIVSLLALIGAGAGYWRYRRAHKQPETKFDTARIERGPLTAKVTATGTLSALVTVQVGTQVSGRVSEIFVDFNSPVKKGQLIAKIDPRLFESTVEQAKANIFASQASVNKAKAQVADAQRQLTRSKALAEGKLIAQADLDTSQANFEVARATVEAAQATFEQAKASYNQARINLDYTSIISPINGVVISRNVDVGQTVAASLQAPVLFTIAEDLKKMQVDTNVAESDVGRLEPEVNAIFTVDAFPSERFRGRIRQIRNAPQTVQNVVTYDAVIDVENPDLKLRPGMTANASVVYAERGNVLRVPNAALRFRPSPAMLEQRPGRPARGAASINQTGSSANATKLASTNHSPDKRTVWVLRGDSLSPRPEPVSVRVGVTDGTNTELLEGALQEGDLVITDAIGELDPSKKIPGVKRMF